jgi:hypothetical protein
MKTFCETDIECQSCLTQGNGKWKMSYTMLSADEKNIPSLFHVSYGGKLDFFAIFG